MSTDQIILNFLSHAEKVLNGEPFLFRFQTNQNLNRKENIANILTLDKINEKLFEYYECFLGNPMNHADKNPKRWFIDNLSIKKRNDLMQTIYLKKITQNDFENDVINLFNQYDEMNQKKLNEDTVQEFALKIFATENNWALYKLPSKNYMPETDAMRNPYFWNEDRDRFFLFFSRKEIIILLLTGTEN